jgi:hypothetical protein
MARLQHFLLTNFNVPLKDVRTDMHGQPVLTPAWLESRIALFEAFCLPSIANQTSSDFEWLIRFGPDTPPDLKARIDRWCQQVNIIPLWNSAPARTAIAARLDGNDTLLLTTRLDNDDGLHPEFVETVQRAVSDRPAEVLDPPAGYSLNVPDGLARRLHVQLGPFLTLAERVTRPPDRTIRSVPHKEAWKLGPVREFAKEPLWLRIVHDRNIWNRPRGEPCDESELRRAFKLEAPKVG